MATAEWAGWMGGIAGGLLGLLGGVLGTWFSIRNTNGPRERRYVIQASLVCWAFVLLFLTGMFLIPASYRFYLWIPYLILLLAGIRTWNRTQMQIRRQEASNHQGQ